MLKFTNVSKSFDGIQAVNDVSFLVREGKTTSLIGPNGAGKTTLFNIATGFLAADSGEVTFKGLSLKGVSPWNTPHLGIGRTFQNIRLFRKLAVLENVLLGIRGQRGEGFLHALIRFNQRSPEHLRNMARANELIDFVGLSSHRSDPADSLSYGEQKLLSIACCLAGDPELLLLDEPVAGLQPEMIGRIEDLISELVRSQKRTLFLIEHDIHFVLRVSETVIVMDDGKKIVEDEPGAIRKNRKILEAYLS